MQAWFTNGDIHRVSDLINIVAAYTARREQLGLKKQFYDKLDLNILATTTYLKPNEALTFLELTFDTANAELLEVFDRIIGTNFESFTTQELYRAFGCFIGADAEVRPKIIRKLAKYI